MNIIICGLTAAGKTTHCELIAQEFKQLGYDYISASTLLLAKKEKSSNQEALPLDYWISDEALTLNNWRRKNRKFDTDLDLQCKNAIDNERGNWVVDVLSASWLSEKPSLKIWLESNLESRTIKAIVSYKNKGRYQPSEIRRRINLIDIFNQEYFLEQHQINFFYDKNPFDFVLDITNFIQEPTEASSHLSIARAQALLSAIIKWKLGFQKNDLRTLYKENSSVFSKVPTQLLYELNVDTSDFISDKVMGDKFSGDKVMGNKIVIENIQGSHNFIGQTSNVHFDNTLSYVVNNALADSFPQKKKVLEKINIIESEASAKIPNPDKVESSIKHIAVMAPDILDVVLDTLSNPAKGFVTVIRKIAEKAKKEYSQKGRD